MNINDNIEKKMDMTYIDFQSYFQCFFWFLLAHGDFRDYLAKKGEKMNR